MCWSATLKPRRPRRLFWAAGFAGFFWEKMTRGYPICMISPIKLAKRHTGSPIANRRLRVSEQPFPRLRREGIFKAPWNCWGTSSNCSPSPPAEFFARLGNVYEQRVDQVEKTIDDSNAVEKIRRGKQVRDLRTKAGDAYVAYSRALTLADDKGYGEALWKGVDLYDRAANIQCVIAALELFVAERPDDSLAPAALLRLGRAYQAAGMFDKAIGAFQRNQFRYPNSLAASKSAVPLAQAYIAKGPEAYGKAESVLKSVVENKSGSSPPPRSRGIWAMPCVRV